MQGQTGGGAYSLRSVSGCGTICTFTNGIRFKVRLGARELQCDSAFTYDAIVQDECVELGGSHYEIGMD